MDNLKLLIIEDDADQRDLMRQSLEDYFGSGTVTCAGTGAEALARDLKSFDLILSDYNLPDATGLELLGKIQAACATPVIMVTGENVAQIATEAIAKGAVDYVVKVGDYVFTIPLVIEKNVAMLKMRRENETLRQELEKALHEVCDKNQQLEKTLLRVEEMAATDALTGLYNRRHFSRVLDQLFAEAQRYEKDLSCVMIDLDSYKQLNDHYGHQMGDELLMLAGKVISANMRRMDVAARYGGDEFVLLLPHADAEEAQTVGRRIREEYLRASASLLNRPNGVTMSIGIGSLRANNPAHADQLVTLADVALYRAKDAGRDGIKLCDTKRPASPHAEEAPAKKATA